MAINYGIGTLIRGSETFFITNKDSLNVVLAENYNRLLIGCIESRVRIPASKQLNASLINTIISNGTIGSDWEEYGIYPITKKESDFPIVTLSQWENYKRENNISFKESINKEALLSIPNIKKGDTTMTFATEPKEAEPIISTTLFSYNFTEEQREDFINKASALFEEYDHPYTREGLLKIWKTYTTNKAGIVGFLSHHPFWDDEKLAIVFPADFKRTRDVEAVNNFCRWIRNQILKLAEANTYKVAGCTREELDSSYSYLKSIVKHMTNLLRCQKDTHVYPYETNYHHSLLFNGNTIEDYQKEKERIEELINIHSKGSDYFYGYYINKELSRRYTAAMRFTDLISGSKEATATIEFAEKANEYAEPFNRVKNGKVIGLGAVEGQKISRIANKFFKNLNFDKIVEMKEESFTDDSGHVHIRNRDNGWNKQFSAFADGINPFIVKKWTIISVNPIDYLTMSFGNGWASCHTIDKNNKRMGDSGYQGCYCSGTMSYMLDGSSMIVYTVNSEYKGSEFCLQDKEQRCVFWVGEDKLIQGRVYPDGRSAGEETSFGGQLRLTVQKVIADCVEADNLWTLEKGTSACGKVINSYGTHYRDYYHYDDCNVSYIKRNGVLKNIKKINIGHDPICPHCGKEHGNEEYLACDHCQFDDDMVYCAHCNEHIHRDEAIYDPDTDNYYCDWECADYDGVHWCENADEYHSEWVYEDDYTEEWFYDYRERNCVHFYYEGTSYNFIDEENAYNMGFVEINGEWYNQEDENVTTCPECGEYILRSDIDNGSCPCCGAIIIDEEELLDEAI